MVARAFKPWSRSIPPSSLPSGGRTIVAMDFESLVSAAFSFCVLCPEGARGLFRPSSGREEEKKMLGDQGLKVPGNHRAPYRAKMMELHR
jgi:hypothetical protein